MPVSVSLFELVRISAEDSRHLWPTQFEGLIRRIESDGFVQDHKTQFGALADLCQEYDEPRLERGFRWLMNRPAIRFDKLAGYETWQIRDAPRIVADFVYEINNEFGARDSIAGCVAHIVLALERIDEATQ